MASVRCWASRPSTARGSETFSMRWLDLKNAYPEVSPLKESPSRPATPRDALADGLSLLPEERKTEGILVSLSAASNIVLPIINRISRAGFVWSQLEREAATAPARAVEMSPRYMNFRIGDLSGGNQQKALLARTMATGTKTLLLFDPTRGVDVGTKEAIYTAIRTFADRGGAVLMYSSELPELVLLADRCLVLYGGSVFAELEGDQIQEHTMVAALTGHQSTKGEVPRLESVP